MRAKIELRPVRAISRAVKRIARIADRPESCVGEIGVRAGCVQPSHVLQLAEGLVDGVLGPVGAVFAGGNVTLFTRGHENAIAIGHAQKPVGVQIGRWRLQMPGGAVGAGVKGAIVADGYHKVR